MKKFMISVGVLVCLGICEGGVKARVVENKACEISYIDEKGVVLYTESNGEECNLMEVYGLNDGIQ